LAKTKDLSALPGFTERSRRTGQAAMAKHDGYDTLSTFDRGDLVQMRPGPVVDQQE
jgi:hypothetical protein